ncbi:MAG: thioredoxin family protein, partial [Betaproteobacteria bacterium]
CYCAEWCDVCGAYRDGFFALAGRFPQAEFRWVDIEDDPPEFEGENFPTSEVARGGETLCRGPPPPRHDLLERLLRELL